ncbi:RsmB/NOP family class I SAM-dependent RNA methyltransferase [Roseovarius salinarum]|uniref:RsmB/NOP family class I SAM-dependent RNA methyltransferase n=1 Tax=Roseovarius salinarum TaxID=1981892 RepID=UPI000C336744|nr:RsmB/NOP family class I SAM-dependent RNA methyltransferase [Roseovarius salinarum]
MTPAARVQAAIGVLDAVGSGTPAEKALTGWARGARYAGSKDRAAVRDHVFHVLRRYRSCACMGGGRTGRALMLGALRQQGADPSEVFTGARHAPAPLTDAEAAAGAPPMTEGDLWDLPDWLIPLFRASLGSGAEATALALRDRAPLMLRANLRKATPAQAREALAQEGVTAVPDPIATTALRVTEAARRVAQAATYREGLVELQDGSGQAAMECLPVAGNARVLDFCAGGGGKTLALAARGTGEFFAHDAAPERMSDLPDRARRAGIAVTRLEATAVDAAAPFDLVLCDVPCSGSGTWRRAPEAKWRLAPADLEGLGRVQAEILDRAARLVAPGGVLAYATCSVLHAENDAQIDAFLARNAGWKAVTRRGWPVGESGDGFFLAQLCRV